MPPFGPSSLVGATFALALAALMVSTIAVAGSATEPPAGRSPGASPASVDLRPRFQQWGLPVRRQGARGTCSVFTVTGALEYAAAAGTGHGTRLSVEFLNWAAHKAVNRAQDGGFFSELWKGFAEFGVCPEPDLPYRSHFDVALEPDPAVLRSAQSLQGLHLRLHWIKEWDVHTGLTPAHLAEIKTTLAGSWPVCGGFRWPKRAEWREGVLQMCPAEEVFDGHSVLLVGYRDDPAQPGGGVFLIRNSGGDGSDGYLPYAYAAAYMNDAAWVSAPKASSSSAAADRP